MLTEQQIELVKEFGIINLPGSIDSEAYLDFLYAITVGRKAHPETPLKLYVCGSGGDVIYGFAIIDLIAKDNNVHGYLVGSAVSAHALIFAACKKRYIVHRGDIAIHPVTSWIDGSSFSANDMRLNAHRTDLLSQRALSIFQMASTKTPKWWEERFNGSGSSVRTFPAAELVSIGFAQWE